MECGDLCILKACICAAQEPSQTSLLKLDQGEIPEEIGNPLEEKGTGDPSLNSLESQDSDDLVLYKRHMGAIAALSGAKSMPGSKFVAPPSKKHLASIAAAQSQGRGFARKQDTFKRHLGSLMALSGQKQRPMIRSLKDSLAYQTDSGPDIFPEAAAMNFATTNGRTYGGMSIPLRYSFELQDNQMTPEYFLMSDNEPTATSTDDFQEMGDSPRNQNMELSGLTSEEITYKPKRFLGPLARGGWFPRQFRGIVSENAFGKRHIGSLARLGWIPHSKATGRLGLGVDEPRAEMGFKRNDMSPRSRMLYHFTAPSLWTSPRGK